MLTIYKDILPVSRKIEGICAIICNISVIRNRKEEMSNVMQSWFCTANDANLSLVIRRLLSLEIFTMFAKIRHMFCRRENVRLTQGIFTEYFNDLWQCVIWCMCECILFIFSPPLFFVSLTLAGFCFKGRGERSERGKKRSMSYRSWVYY